MSAPGSIVVSGQVLDVAPLSGVSPKTGNPWSFTVVAVLVGKAVQEVRFDNRTVGAPPKVGDVIAVDVLLSVYQNTVQCSVTRYAELPALVKTS